VALRLEEVFEGESIAGVVEREGLLSLSLFASLDDETGKNC
jgi:hypothetical protein